MEKCVIIGAGPAGTSASIYLARSNIAPLVIYNGVGSLEKAELIENYYGFPDKISGKVLFEKGVKQAKNLGVSFVKSEVVSVFYDGNYIVNTTSGSYPTKTIILATGSSRKVSSIKGLSNLEGKGVSYCAICDGFFYRDKITAVIGNTNFALHEAEILAQTSNKVYILTNGLKKEFATDNEKIEIIKTKISSINGEEKVESVTFDTGDIIKVQGVFVALGTASSSDIARQIGAVTDDDGKIHVDENMMTTTPGVFAAGDCIGGLFQICKAATDGAMAAFSIIKYLKNN